MPKVAAVVRCSSSPFYEVYGAMLLLITPGPRVHQGGAVPKRTAPYGLLPKEVWEITAQEWRAWRSANPSY